MESDVKVSVETASIMPVKVAPSPHVGDGKLQAAVLRAVNSAHTRRSYANALGELAT